MPEEMPLMSGLVDGAEEEAPDEEEVEEELPMGNMLEQAQHYAEKAEVYAADCESIAEMLPDASAQAKEARAAAEEATTAVATVEAAQTTYDGALATSGLESPEAVAALRELEDSLRIVKEAYDRSMTACEEAKGMMPQLETGTEGGLMEWADRTAG